MAWAVCRVRQYSLANTAPIGIFNRRMASPICRAVSRPTEDNCRMRSGSQLCHSPCSASRSVCDQSVAAWRKYILYPPARSDWTSAASADRSWSEADYLGTMPHAISSTTQYGHHFNLKTTFSIALFRLKSAARPNDNDCNAGLNLAAAHSPIDAPDHHGSSSIKIGSEHISSNVIGHGEREWGHPLARGTGNSAAANPFKGKSPRPDRRTRCPHHTELPSGHGGR